MTGGGTPESPGPTRGRRDLSRLVQRLGRVAPPLDHLFEQEGVTPRIASYLGQHHLLQPPLERGLGDQDDGPVHHVREFVAELLDLSAEPSARLQLVEHVDLTV
jgi:hypothetical protein